MSSGLASASGVRRERHDSAFERRTRPKREVLLRRFLEAYWLRPENAFWMTLRSETLAECKLLHPSIDLGCGDGVFSFLHFGGEFDRSFDVFTSVSYPGRTRDQSGDMFDHLSDSYRPTILAQPTDTFDVGTDIKTTMLAKAGRLDFYGRLVEHDNNQPQPFADDSFRSVYCNTAYWATDIERFLTQINRITQPGGSIILQVKLESMRRYTLEAHRDALGDRFLDLINRGRIQSWPTVGDRATWESRFAAAGLSIQSATPFVTRTHAHIWDIGLRPIAPLLTKMAGALTPETRAAIKQEWVDLFCDLLTPLCDPGLNLLTGAAEPAEIQYVLRPEKQ